ncbi:ABC transporter substrate-binding protein [Novibacillus thermophilus]|jgi:multiple sugar transport system substrate-binding protein|uniref:Sugar ABC transporter substrate-binding protein n=1 Tax=Novibacillus thermophilus TaxID=1471761 RepID=A0A1U9K451_9BACL|nr:sugar ABC transporter substrate-binding protein [Novibacillus thermophilus]AQS54806.1 hypothetical protein B0W44_02500 [Novibacillus thermophilus]
MRKILLVLMALLMAFSLAACSSSSDDATADQEDGNITLRVAWWGSQTRHDKTMEVIKMYEKENPHVTIETEFTGYDGYWEKMAAQAAGGNLPDVIQQDFGEYMTQYSEKGLLADLDEFVDNGTIDVSHFDDLLIDSGVMDGQLKGIPLGMNAYAVMYDPEMLESAGIELPSMEWSWDEFKDIAKKAAEVYDYGSSDFADNRHGFEVFARQHGQSLFTEDGSALGFDDEVLTGYWKLLLELQEEGIIPPPDVALEYVEVENSLLSHGKAPFQIRWSNQAVAVASTVGKDLKMATIPGDVKGLFVKPAMFFSISETSDKKEEAAKFINFFVNNVEAQKVQELDRGVPPSSNVREEMVDNLSATDRETFDYIDYLLEKASPIDKGYPLQAAEVFKLFDDLTERVLYQEITPEKGAEEFRTQAEEIISQ